jgi:hypothetical protein
MCISICFPVKVKYGGMDCDLEIFVKLVST